ncbi:hypothetical protein PR048_032165 [Dryococelus australis]|uniref:Reverse transcriptase domain-containing protein n=1 Tax=Dryococelus australis TaxID=614101 RepID=A0ABQ9G4F4_9NEOP|nr:hypothetical protein PR048_032165 [Dryococelus australis]
MSTNNITVSILRYLCSDIIVGHDIFKRDSSLQEIFGGEKALLDICSVAAANFEPAQLFTHLSPQCLLSGTYQRRRQAIYSVRNKRTTLYQFTRVPVGNWNGVPAFQLVMQTIVQDEDLKGVEVYLDDATVGGLTQEEHDANLKKCMNAVSKYNLTLNMDKNVSSVSTIHLLGYVVSHKHLVSDPDHPKPLRNLPVPTNTPSLCHAQVQSTFPLNQEAVKIFEQLKSDVKAAVVSSIDDEATFTVESDASDFETGTLCLSSMTLFTGLEMKTERLTLYQEFAHQLKEA